MMKYRIEVLQIMQNLGLAAPKEYLRRYGNSLLGVHLHDVLGCQDHLPPGEGAVDFNALKEYLKRDTLKVLEPHHPANAESIKKSKFLLESLLDGKI